MMRQRFTNGRRTAALALALTAVALAAPSASAAADRIFTIAGSGVQSFSGDGQLATLAGIDHPRGLALLPDGGFLFADAFGQRVRRVSPDGNITTAAGTGVAGFSGDGGPATSAQLWLPHAVVVLDDGSFLIADNRNFRIRQVSGDGTITTAAGTGVKGFSGDGGPATAAKISGSRGIDGTPGGGYLIADSDNNRIRRVSSQGTITTVAGTGVAGFSGDGGLATSARLNVPFGVAALDDGGFLIADINNHRIRRVTAAGKISTVAGTGVQGFSGDGGPATAAKLNGPHSVEPLPGGAFLIADTQNHRIRQVAADGTITTIAGSGVKGFGGEGGAVSNAALNNPKAILPFAGGLLMADSDNHRLRFIGAGPWPTPAPGAGWVSISGAAAYTTSPVVDVSVEAQGVSNVRLSNSPDTSGGVLVSGATYSYSSPIGWDLSDAASGGSGANGTRYVYVQWQDSNGSWSPVARDSIVFDQAVPTTTAPTEKLVTSSTLGSSTVPVTLSWSGSDATSGVAGYDLEQSTDGGGFTAFSPSPGASTSSTAPILPGGSYSFRARATDRAGNVGSWATGRTFGVDLLEESNSAVAYGGLWSPDAPSGASGGATSYTTESGATATLSFTGRSVAWVAPTSSARGSAEIYLDGTRVATVSLYSASTSSRKLVYTKAWATAGAHTLKVRNLATSGRPRIDVDAFVVLR